MKRNPRNPNRFEMKPLKIDLSEAEILADLQYGVGTKVSAERSEHRKQTTR